MSNESEDADRPYADAARRAFEQDRLRREEDCALELERSGVALAMREPRA